MQLSTLATTLGLALVVSGQKVKFMPLGDSITQATCWRAKVWDSLVVDGLSDSIDFIGSQNSNDGGCKAAEGNFDLDHEGHSGFEAVEIATQYIDEWSAAKADIVNIHLGTNDIKAGITTEEILEAYDTILAALRTANPSVKVIVDKIIPNPNFVEETLELNEAIPEWVRQNDSEESNMSTADCSQEAGYDPAWNPDGLHPGNDGDEFIASKVGPLLTTMLEDSI